MSLPTEGIVATLSEAREMVAKAVEAEKPRTWTSEAGPLQTKRVHEALKEIASEHGMMTELNGVIGVDERRFSYFVVFGGGHRDDVAVVQKAIAEEFNYTVTRKNYQQIIAAAQAALPALRANRPVKDQRITPEQQAQELQEREQREAERGAEKRSRELQIDASVQELRKQYPWAIPGAAAANLKTELTNAFPGIRFSVTTKHHSSIVARWTLGPSEKDTKDIISKYESGTFDSMTDCAGYDHSVYGEAVERVLGRERFCRGSREIPDEIFQQVGRLLCETQGVEYQGNNTQLDLNGDVEWVSTHTHRLLGRTSFPANFEITGIEYRDGGYSENTGEDEESGYYLTFAELEQPQAVAPVAASGIVRENPAKGGIEIKFPSREAAEPYLGQLKTNGWRWLKFQKLWYTKASPRARAFAESLSGQSLSDATDPMGVDRQYEDDCQRITGA